MSFFPYAVAVYLFLIGLYGVVSSRNLVHLIICMTIVQSSTYILLLGIGYQGGSQAPIFADIPGSTPAVDPVVQALSLVDVVVEATVTALLLGLAVQADKRFHSIDPDELRPLLG